MNNNVLLPIFFLQVLGFSGAVNQCEIESRIKNYYKIKSCYRSKSLVLYRKQVDSLENCKAVAREKNGLAFNFSPPEAKNFIRPTMPNCHILECPDIENNSTIAALDPAYDYYSAYGNLSLVQNATCVKSVGLFIITNDYQNYSQSIISCQNISGELADITSEYRTSILSQVIKDRMLDWYKAAFVGLDDMDLEGVFRTSLGKPLTCSKYRAWAPGHPRSKHQLEDCVTLDSEGLWRVAKCNKVKLKGLCEIYSHPSNNTEQDFRRNVTCNYISDKHKGRKKKCLQEKELFLIYQNSSRLDRCALSNFNGSE